MSPETHEEAGRFEFKYRISCREYYAVRCAIAQYMRRDFHTLRAGGDRGYFVRSLYYETADYGVYAQKMAGNGNRAKYRLRSYEDAPSDGLSIRAEIKVRKGESLAKYQAFVPFRQYLRFLRCKDWEEADHPVLEEFSRGVHLAGLHPCVLVDYHREGYESRGNDGVRITFDHAVRSAQADCLFPVPKPFFRVHHSHEVVLEIKFRQAPPDWLKCIVQAYGLRLVANSKFTQGIEVGRRDRCPPNGILIVR
jgi:hypothetical protein